MNVKNALVSRHACRAFNNEQLQKEILLEVIDEARHTPSWANTQPWIVYAAGGEILRQIKSDYLDTYDHKVSAAYDISGIQQWPSSESARMQKLMSDISDSVANSGELFSEANREFFHAPAVLFLYMDKELGSWSMFDLGAFSQSIMLTATEQGLACMPAAELVRYPSILRKDLKIPEYLSIVIGIAIGYEDKDHPLNQFRSSRKEMHETAVLKGFAQ